MKQETIQPGVFIRRVLFKERVMLSEQTFFQKNYEFIATQPERFRIKPGFCRFALHYEVLKSREDVPGLVYSGTDERVTLHSTYFPLKEANKQVEAFESDSAAIVVSGMGLGYA